MSKPFVFYINGMSCVSCSNTIESALRQQYATELEYFHADLTMANPKKTTIILAEQHSTHESTWTALKKQIQDFGFECQDKNYEPHQESNKPVEVDTAPWIVSGKKIITSHWFLGSLGCVTGLALLITCLAAGSLVLTTMLPLAILSTILTLALGANSYYDSWKKLVQSKTLTMDTLFSISTLSVLSVSIAAFFIPWLPMMFEAGLLIYGFRHIGLAIEDSIKEKINSAQFQDRAPKKVRLYLKSSVQEIELHYIKVDDIIELHPGELVPIDGFCEEESLLYNTIVTGAVLPQAYRAGDKILAGMRLADNSKPLKMRALHKAADSYLARLDAGITQSIHEKAPLELTTEQLLSYFIPTVIVLAALSGVVVSLFSPPALAIQCAISVLVSACPCTLGLVIPLAVKTGIHKAAEHGVHFKNAKVLQQTEQIDSIVFDLNGTLTTGIPVVKHYGVLPGIGVTPKQLLSISAALEAESMHPIGKAIYSFAKTNNIAEARMEQRDDSSHHAGIRGQINQQNYSIGSQALMQEQGITTAAVEAKLCLDAGDSVVYIAREGVLIGYIVMTDPLRNDAYQTVNTLSTMGKTVHLCTGADEPTARRYAEALNINHVYANTVPTALEHNDKTKPAYIKLLQSQNHKVAMVGDAGNDASALAASDLGIAVLSPNSDELTQKHAGAVIQNGTLSPIASAFTISQQTVQNIHQNLLLSLGYNLAAVVISGGLLVALGLTVNPAIGAALMAIQACIVLLNVYHFKQKEIPHLNALDHSIQEGECPTSSFHLIQQNSAVFEKELQEEKRGYTEVSVSKNNETHTLNPPLFKAPPPLKQETCMPLPLTLG